MKRIANRCALIVALGLSAVASSAFATEYTLLNNSSYSLVRSAIWQHGSACETPGFPGMIASKKVMKFNFVDELFLCTYTGGGYHIVDEDNKAVGHLSVNVGYYAGPGEGGYSYWLEVQPTAQSGQAPFRVEFGKGVTAGVFSGFNR